MPRRTRRKYKTGVRRDRIFIRKNVVMDTIVNYPLDMEGIPLFSRAVVHERKRLRVGWHNRWRAILKDNRDEYFLREVIH